MELCELEKQENLLRKNILYFEEWNFLAPSLTNSFTLGGNLQNLKNKQKNLLWKNFLSLMTFLQPL